MMADIVWLAFARSALESRIAEPGERGELVIFSKRDAGIYHLAIMVAAHLNVLQEEFGPRHRVD